MSILTFLTAPWAFGAAYQVAMAKRKGRHAFVAVVACLFSASWFYDGWLLYRDGHYSGMWLPNLLLSPFLYVAAGILWNLELDEAGKPALGFTRASWPVRSAAPHFDRMLAFAALPPIIVAASVLLFSVRWQAVS